MAEQYANVPSTTLNSSATSGATSISVASGAVFPSSGNFALKCESEIMICTTRSGNTLTVIRGQEGTSAASHISGTTIISPLTARSLLALSSRINLLDTSRPSAGNEGTIYIPQDDWIAARDNGTSWDNFGPIYQFTPPVSADFTSINSPTVVEDNGGIKLIQAGGSNDWSVYGFTKAIGSGDREVLIAAHLGLHISPNSIVCFGFRNNSNDKVVFLRIANDSNILNLDGIKLDSATSGSNSSGIASQLNASDIISNGLIWVKLKRISTTLHYLVGMTPDEDLMYEFFTEPISSNLGTADHWFFGIIPYNKRTAMRVVSWKEGPA